MSRRICDTSLTKYDIVKDVLKSRNYVQCKPGAVDANWTLQWIDTNVSVERILDMTVGQKINHFPGMESICRKSRLARNLARMHRLFPDDYSFTPRTYRVPSDLASLTLAIKSNTTKTFIAKPDAGCQGKGIQLFSDEEGFKLAMERASSFVSANISLDVPVPRGPILPSEVVVQEYIAKPCLLDGHKFDLRVYALVLSVNPLLIYVHKDGLARLAAKKYVQPSKENFSHVTMHLTNYAVNKDDPTFVAASKDELEGGKRSMSSVLDWIREQDTDASRDVWSQIKSVIVKTIVIAQPALEKTIAACRQRMETSTKQHSSSPCFEILGFDIMLDSKLKPWVLEVNHSPSFTCDSELDTRVKSAVIGDTLDLLDVPLLRHDSGTDLSASSPSASGWEVAYPSHDKGVYDTFISAASSILGSDTELTKSRKAFREAKEIERVEQETKAALIRERAKLLRASCTLGVAPARLVPLAPVVIVREPPVRQARVAMKMASIDLGDAFKFC
ncbi:hypothetical protein SmJEL517_g00187 [Synchytrium microbalum]|uniref:Tubulin-tyrosine ligase n=1 Tax=Synchytrium microbalum TaxID=1806994 RepID=A0A507CG53_9FUNG|nr:uncharacterized protein SmJEL517_g00187 [Synchytrium microbalum]TPX38169.1 hypothetical protein SmJEL517_g00187 [Synchytrium microbalum]